MRRKKVAATEPPKQSAGSLQTLLASWYQTVKQIAASEKNLEPGAKQVADGIQEMQTALCDPEKAVSRRKQADESAARNNKEKRDSVIAVNRAIKHLRDWQHRLEEDGYLAMAAEIDGVANDLSTPACLLGGKAAFTMSLQDVMGEARNTRMTLQGVGN